MTAKNYKEKPAPGKDESEGPTLPQARLAVDLGAPFIRPFRAEHGTPNVKVYFVEMKGRPPASE